jgi:Ser/Thr protein kinase RdoA (MazF antagonist)
MTTEPASRFSDVFAHFAAEDVPHVSHYRFAPVFPCRIGTTEVVIKRTRRLPETAAAIAGWTSGLAAQGVPVVSPVQVEAVNPVRIGENFWVAYPFISGEQYTAAPGQAGAAGELLGRIHAAHTPVTPPPFSWPSPDAEGIAEDQQGLAKVLTDQAPETVEGLSRLVAEFPERILPRIREARLPMAGAVMDYKANNLIYAESGPVLIDPDNADWAPRILDLALAVLQFHIEHPTSPGRLFSPAEWREFRDGYLRHVTLTDDERALWPLALEYMLSEYGVWSLIESEEWDDPRERAFMVDLAGIEIDRFPLAD